MIQEENSEENMEEENTEENMEEENMEEENMEEENSEENSDDEDRGESQEVINNRRRVHIPVRRRLMYTTRNNTMRGINNGINTVDNINYTQTLNSVTQEMSNLIIQNVECETVSKERECGICREEKSDLELIETPCKHMFCRNCFFHWLSKKETCALCRKKFCDVRNLTDSDAEDEISYLQTKTLNLRDKLDTLKKRSIKIIKNQKVEIDTLNNKRINIKKDIEYAKGYKEGLIGNILKKSDLCIETPFKNGYLRAFWDTRNPEEADILYKDLKTSLLDVNGPWGGYRKTNKKVGELKKTYGRCK
jgi:hypothetical protein